MPGKAKQPTRVTPAPRAGQRTAAQRSAAQRSAAQKSVRAARGGPKSRWVTVGAPVLVVILLVGVLVAVKASSGSSGPKSGKVATTATQTVAQEVTSVPAAVLNQVGVGSLSASPKALTGAALTAGSLPRVLYVGAEWCPYCAAERWALAVALSRFGTLTGLGEVQSSSTDVYPSTSTLTFHGATYTSTYLSLTAREIYSNQASGGSYAPLDTLTAADKSLFESVGGGGFPFIDIGGRYLFSATYDPATLKGLTQDQIAKDLSDPSSAVAKGVDGSANVITAAICATTNQQPASVCDASGVKAGAAVLPKA